SYCPLSEIPKGPHNPSEPAIPSLTVRGRKFILLRIRNKKPAPVWSTVTSLRYVARAFYERFLCATAQIKSKIAIYLNHSEGRDVISRPESSQFAGITGLNNARRGNRK